MQEGGEGGLPGAAAEVPTVQVQCSGSQQRKHTASRLPPASLWAPPQPPDWGCCSRLMPGPHVVPAQMPGQPVRGAHGRGGACLASPGSAGSLGLEKVDGGFGSRPLFLGLLREASQEEVGPAAWGRGSAPLCPSPGSSPAPVSCPVPSLRRLGASVSALSWLTLLDFLLPLPECREQAGSLCPPTFEGHVF